MSYTNDLQVVVYGERAAVLAEAERWKERAGLSDTEKDDIIIELARDGRLVDLPEGKAAWVLWTDASGISDAIDSRLALLFDEARPRGLSCAFSRIGEGSDGFTDEACDSDDDGNIELHAWPALHLPIRLPGVSPREELRELVKWALGHVRRDAVLYMHKGHEGIVERLIEKVDELFDALPSEQEDNHE